RANIVTDRGRLRPPRDETEQSIAARARVSIACSASGRRTGIIRRGAITISGGCRCRRHRRRRCFRTIPHGFCSWCAAGWPTGSSPFTSLFTPAPSSGYYVAAASLVVIV
ncbi:hypothetical protein ALC60_14687, partial [Trachymyrmex zeteki]